LASNHRSKSSLGIPPQHLLVLLAQHKHDSGLVVNLIKLLRQFPTSSPDNMALSDTDDHGPARKRTRGEVDSNGEKKQRGRPRVDTQDETAADVSSTPLPTSLSNREMVVDETKSRLVQSLSAQPYTNIASSAGELKFGWHNEHIASEKKQPSQPSSPECRSLSRRWKT